MKRKFCIFCGKNPVNKNKEHVIPKWLLELTGDPNRTTNVGTNYKGDKIIFPWSKYVFPSCEICNTEFGIIEAKVKIIVLKILTEKPILHQECNLFLDWLDKVRTGIWLGQLILKKIDIDPHFYINKRVGEKDRICLIYKIDDLEKGIGLIGTDTPLFQFVPSSFALTINNFCFFSYSQEFIVSENLGFPFPEDYVWFDNGQIGINDFNDGKTIVSKQILEGQILKPSLRLYQTILNLEHNLTKPQIGRRAKFYKEFCNVFNSNFIQSRIYIINDYNGDALFWSKGENYKFDGLQKIERTLMFHFLAKMVIEHQIQSARQHFNQADENSKKIVDWMKELIEMNERILKTVDIFLRKVVPDYYK